VSAFRRTTADVRLKPDSTTATQGLTADTALRAATIDDAQAIHDLISSQIAHGHLLPRTLSDITVHAHRIVVAVIEDEIVGCVDLAPLSRTVAEVRSLVVSEELRSNGVGRQLIDAVVANARRAGFERICAFTHAPSYFVQRGFSLVPHEWLPEKIRTDCGSCARFRHCNQYAVVFPLARVHDACVPLASLHG
jgi:N-acetylglutamate synthase-like GNAT family acetyltransferase